MNKKIFKESEYTGIYRAVNKSFGFVQIDEKEEEIYVASKDSLFAMTGDKVIVKIIKNDNSKKSREGKIIKIVNKNTDTITGIFSKNKNYAFVIPINKKIPFDIFIEKKFFKNAVNGSIVVAKILTSKNKGNNPEGVILEVLGHKDDPNVEITSIVKEYKIKDTFDDNALKEADRVAKKIEDDDIINRKDLREKFFITIDGEDTKDIDDAIFLEKNDSTYKLYVSIADVAHYVKENSFLDNEAKERGNSVYLLDRVIPMLPRILSNGMCSLNENEDRLSLTCEMTFDENGEVISHEIYESIINSHKRMTYNEVEKIIDDTYKDCEYEISLIEMLKNIYNLSKKIRANRFKKGSISFDISEMSIAVNEDLVPINICEKVRLKSQELIEDCMVIANETVATEYFYREIPFLYRTHEPCDIEKLETLSYTLTALGIPFVPKKNMHPKEMQKILEEVKDKEYKFIIEKLMLRSMSQAKYTKDALGHFALASKYYTHFTSPIRRYNDLVVHRIIKEVLHGSYDEKRKEHYNNILDGIAKNISITERIAIDCERDIEDLKKCEYMQDKLYNEYDGIVSGLTNFGIFVELDNMIEGLIPLRDLKDDFYVFDEKKFVIQGERNKKTFVFGQKVRIRVIKVIKETRNIDFELVN